MEEDAVRPTADVAAHRPKGKEQEQLIRYRPTGCILTATTSASARAHQHRVQPEADEYCVRAPLVAAHSGCRRLGLTLADMHVALAGGGGEVEVECRVQMQKSREFTRKT